MKKLSYFKSSIIILTVLICNRAYSLKEYTQADTTLAPNISAIPVINGNGDDQCWQNVPWQTIDQVWIPYGGEVDSDDYSGHYKIVWSSSTNLIYFLIEVIDDEFVDGFISGQTADEYNFDIAEVFIDENCSGGFHIFDATGRDTLQFGSNAENAFTYHIYADFPEEGGTTTEHYVGDLDGTGWGNVSRPNYASHLPEFALHKSGTTAVWEFSLKVYNDTYEDSNIDPARVQLETDKIIGLSVAYCDNDNPDGQRDNMFGSVWEPSPGNLHWQNADYFGRVKLVQDISAGIAEEQTVQLGTMKVYPNPSSSFINLQLNDPYNGEIGIRIYNILGQEVFRTYDIKTSRVFRKKIFLNNLSTGIYFLQTQIGKINSARKFIIN